MGDPRLSPASGRPVSLVACMAAALLGAQVAGGATSGEATLQVELEAGRWKGVRIKSIPRGAQLSAAVESDGQLAVLLLDAAQYARFPAGERMVFRGRSDGRLEFSVKAPRSGDYYLILDNREGSQARSVQATIRGEVDGAERSGSEPTESGGSDEAASDEAAEAKLAELREQLARIFVFEEFPIEVRRCGRANAFGGDGGIVLCREYAAALYLRLGDREKAGDALLFALFHELGHVLLAQWGHPLYENEEAADEFAAAVLVMAGQGARLRAQAEYLEANSTFLEALARAFVDDRHPLSVQRARNLRRWADDPELVHRWQSVFVPRMQTRVLEQLREAPTPWSDAALVEQELARR